MFDIDLIAFSHNEGEEQYVDYLQDKLNISITLIPITLNPWRKIHERLFDVIPDNYARWLDEDIKLLVKRRIEASNYQFIHCIDNCMTQYCLNANKSVHVMTDHSRIDSEYQLEKFKYLQGFKKKILALEILVKTILYEKRLNRRFPNHIVCSDEDAQYLTKHNSKHINVLTIVNGFDTESFPILDSINRNKNKVLIFTGAMDYTPNIDAMHWFCSEIFPRILSQYPNTILKIVGIKPVESIQNLQSTNIHVLGAVDDISTYYQTSDLYICPLRIGGGSRLKLVEAMAMKCPIVTTNIAAQGLILKNNKHVIFADTAHDFAQYCNAALCDQSLLDNLALGGYHHAHSAYEWQILLKPILHYYQNQQFKRGLL